MLLYTLILLLYCVVEEPGTYPIYDENVTQIALLISVTVCLTILIFTVAFVYLRSVSSFNLLFLYGICTGGPLLSNTFWGYVTL